MTTVSVVSCAGSGSHRKEMRVEKRQDELAGLPVFAMTSMQLRFDLLRRGWYRRSRGLVASERLNTLAGPDYIFEVQRARV